MKDLTKLENAIDALKEALLEVLESSGGSASTQGADEVSLAEAKIDDMTMEELTTLANAVRIPTDSLEEEDLRGLLTTAQKVVADDTVTPRAIKMLALSIGLTPSKDAEETIAEVATYLTTPAEDEVPEKAKKSKKAAATVEDDDDDSVEEVSEEDKLERLNAYNEVADEAIEFDASSSKAVKSAYAKLEKLLKNDDGELIEWGVPYIKDGSGFCCGLELDEVKVKGVSDALGKCLVTDKTFKYDSDTDTFAPYKAAKK